MQNSEAQLPGQVSRGGKVDRGGRSFAPRLLAQNAAQEGGPDSSGPPGGTPGGSRVTAPHGPRPAAAEAAACRPASPSASPAGVDLRCRVWGVKECGVGSWHAGTHGQVAEVFKEVQGGHESQPQALQVRRSGSWESGCVGCGFWCVGTHDQVSGNLR